MHKFCPIRKARCTFTIGESHLFKYIIIGLQQFFSESEKYILIGILEIDLQYRISSDYEWMLRVLSNDSVKLGYLPKVLVHMRTGGLSNRSLKNILIKSK